MALIGWWQFENNINDSSMYEWSSSLSGSVTYEQGPIGKCISTGVIPARVDLFQDNTLTLQTANSVSAFVYLDTGYSTGASALFGSYTFPFGWMLYRDTSATVWKIYARFINTSGTATAGITSTFTIPTGKWTHICVVRGATGNIKIYMDAVLVIDYTLSSFWHYSNSTLAGAGQFAILAASRGNTDRLCQYTKMSDVKIFNHELSLKEIEELSKAKIFHVDFEDTCDNIAGRVATASYAANTGFLHKGTGSTDTTSNRIGDSTYEVNAQANALNYGSPSVLQYDQSASGHTFAFWINETNYASPSRQNPFAKAYGGEGTLVLENTNYFNLYWGTSGINSAPYISDSGPASIITNNTWKYITAVRDRDNKKFHWYTNGNFIETDTPGTWYEPTAGTQPFYLFDGYVNYLNGYLDDFRIYATTMSAAQIKELYNAKAYLTSQGSYIAKGSVKDTDFYYGFEGAITDSRAFEYNVGGGTITFGYVTGSRKTLRMINNDAAWDMSMHAQKGFYRPAVFYGNIKVDAITGATMVGWRKNTGAVSNIYTDAVQCLYFSNADIRVYQRSPNVNVVKWAISSSQWYDFKFELTETSGCKYYVRLPAVEKDWNLIYTDTVQTYNPVWPCSIHYSNTVPVYHDNWAVSSLDNDISYYGDIHSNKINEIGTVDNLRVMWSLNNTTASYTSESANLYPLIASTNTINFCDGPSYYGGVLLNYTASGMTTEYFTFFNTITYLSNTQPFTAMAWIYLSGSSHRHQTIMGNTAGTSKIGITNQGYLYYTTSEIIYVFGTSKIVPLNQWTHICLTSTGATNTYIDGQIVHSTGNTFTQSFNTIGAASSSATTRFAGKIADVRIYSRELSQNEVLTIYELYSSSSMLIKNTETYSSKFGENY